MQWEWLLPESVLEIHAQQIELFGGQEGLRDPGLLDSALSRPQSLAYYGEPSLAELAAAYATAITCGHPFWDGNKRTGFVVAATFVELHGRVVEADQAEVVNIFLALATGELSKEELANWFEDHMLLTE